MHFHVTLKWLNTLQKKQLTAEPVPEIFHRALYNYECIISVFRSNAEYSISCSLGCFITRFCIRLLK